MSSELKVDKLQNLSGVTALNVNNLTNGTSRYLRQIYRLVDTTDRSTGASWTLGTTFADLPDFKAGSVLKIYYNYPCRNDSTGWGGLYFEPQIRFNAGGWQSLGSRGYDAVMNNGTSDISYTNNQMYIDPGMFSTFSVGIRFYFCSYDGTVGLNNGQGHDVNTVSGTATIMSGDNGNQHFGHWIVEELALFGTT